MGRPARRAAWKPQRNSLKRPVPQTDGTGVPAWPRNRLFWVILPALLLALLAAYFLLRPDGGLRTVFFDVPAPQSVAPNDAMRILSGDPFVVELFRIQRPGIVHDPQFVQMKEPLRTPISTRCRASA